MSKRGVGTLSDRLNIKQTGRSSDSAEQHRNCLLTRIVTSADVILSSLEKDVRRRVK